MLPKITYPDQLDTTTNLYTVKDSAYLKLSIDYNPGDKEIVVEYDLEKTGLFPTTGIISLVEQCSDPKNRAISFYYTSFANNIFSGLTILDGFEDIEIKPKEVTVVVMNVMAEHHNALKNALIAIEKFAGARIPERKSPYKPKYGSLEKRTNCMSQIAYQPIAWFEANKTVGKAPFTVTFKNLSIRLGEEIPQNTVKFYWDFGDNTSSTVTYVKYSDEVPSGVINVIVEDTDSGTIKKTYTEPGIYSVSLRVVNDFGEDTVLLNNLINSRYIAPDAATIEKYKTSIQQVVNGIFKSPSNLQIQINVTNNGEHKNPSGQAIDPVTTYTWYIPDDINHGNSSSTTALFSVGGIYTISLRVDTRYLAYRITNFKNDINIVEKENLWLWTFFSSSSQVIQASEMGFLSQTFKTKQNSYSTIYKNDNFITASTWENKSQIKFELSRNTNFRPYSEDVSGLAGYSLLYYATGRNSTDPISTEKINCLIYNGYLETYNDFTSLQRPWNWVPINIGTISYFLFGEITSPQAPYVSQTNWQNLQAHNIINNTVTSLTLTTANFIGLSGELQNNAAIYNTDGTSKYGYFSSYRYANRDNKVYILKNDKIGGTAFRIKNFYQSNSTVGNDIANFTKLPDMLGPTKTEGQLVNLESGLFFFNNSGSISQFDTSVNVWRTGGPGLYSTSFADLQDKTQQDYDNTENSLLATSDGQNNAYISFDYSPNSYIKFNDLDMTFTKLNKRPDGEQWNIGSY